MDEMERPHCRQRYPGELGRLSSASPHAWPVPFREGQGVLFPRNTGGKETTARGGCHVVLSRSRFPQCSCGSILLRTLSSTLEHTSDTHPGLISFRMDWLDLLPVQGTVKNLLQHHNSKASILQHSAFFTVQPSHPYMTTGKTIALTRRTFTSNFPIRLERQPH